MAASSPDPTTTSLAALSLDMPAAASQSVVSEPMQQDAVRKDVITAVQPTSTADASQPATIVKNPTATDTEDATVKPTPALDSGVQQQPIEEKDYAWPVKRISWPPVLPPSSNRTTTEMSVRTSRFILLQDTNGPCSLLALINILLLRGDVSLPDYITRSEGSRVCPYSVAASLIGEYLIAQQQQQHGSGHAEEEVDRSFESLAAVLDVLPQVSPLPRNPISALDRLADCANRQGKAYKSTSASVVLCRSSSKARVASWRCLLGRKCRSCMAGRATNKTKRLGMRSVSYTLAVRSRRLRRASTYSSLFEVVATSIQLWNESL